MRSTPTIIVDTRERLPFHFDRAITKTLRTGDYSVAGLEDSIAIERKSLSDLLGCIGGSRDRFERELGRLRQIEYATIVVEATLQELLNDNQSDIHSSAILGSIVSWSWRYHLPIWFAGDRPTAQTLVERLLTKAAEYSSSCSDEDRRGARRRIISA